MSIDGMEKGAERIAAAVHIVRNCVAYEMYIDKISDTSADLLQDFLLRRIGDSSSSYWKKLETVVAEALEEKRGEASRFAWN